jgi:hypothetical protein
VTKLLLGPWFITEQPPLLAHFFTSLSHPPPPGWSHYSPPSRDLIHSCPLWTFTRAPERFDCPSPTADEKKTQHLSPSEQKAPPQSTDGRDTPTPLTKGWPKPQHPTPQPPSTEGKAERDLLMGMDTHAAIFLGVENWPSRL